MTWQKWGSRQAPEKRKTSLSLMEVFNIATEYIDKNIGWCLTFVGVYICNMELSSPLIQSKSLDL
jgi:hypothetical protein